MSCSLLLWSVIGNHETSWKIVSNRYGTVCTFFSIIIWLVSYTHFSYSQTRISVFSIIKSKLTGRKRILSTSRGNLAVTEKLKIKMFSTNRSNSDDPDKLVTYNKQLYVLPNPVQRYWASLLSSTFAQDLVIRATIH